MRNIQGHVFIAQIEKAEFLFGKRVGKSDGDYENLATNNIVPYETEEAARAGMEDFDKKRAKTSLSLARLEMQIAEDAKDLEKFRNKEGLIVIAEFDLGKVFLGPVVEGKPTEYPLPGADSSRTEFTTLKGKNNSSAYERALYLWNEARRQGRGEAAIASFRLERL